MREPELQEFWKEYNLYQKLSEQAGDSDRFVLHDGPPYANGDLHCGHAMNKILKDFINRKQVLNGKQVHYVPGWDCHGLPIELKVLQAMKSKERRGLTPITLRERAAVLEEGELEEQKLRRARAEGAGAAVAHPRVRRRVLEVRARVQHAVWVPVAG